MFKKIMTGCLVALAVTMSACEYGEPLNPEIRYIRAGAHILKINNKVATPTMVNIPVMCYTVASSLSTGNDADFDGKYVVYKLMGARYTDYVRLGGAVVLKHETKNYYIVNSVITTDETGQDDTKIHLYFQYPYEAWIDPDDHTQGTAWHSAEGVIAGPAFTGQGVWYSTWFSDAGVINVPFPTLPYKIATPISMPITVYTDLTKYAAQPLGERPDYIALQYSTNWMHPNPEWITIKEINNPKWDDISDYSLPVFGRYITIPALVETTQVAMRVCVAYGFTESYGLEIPVTLSTNRRPTW